MSPVFAALRARAAEVRPVRIFSGQHRELARELFPDLEMEPDLSLELMRDSQSLEDLGARGLVETARLLERHRPACVLVQGDTSTVLFTSLACYFGRVPLGHVEAGLRSFDKFAPFPEEMMRRLTDSLADLHFAPTEHAVRNLRTERITPTSIFLTGNTAIDAVRHAALVAQREVSVPIRQWVESSGQYVVMTLHRRESFGEDMHQIMAGVAGFAKKHPRVRFIYPVHPNPNLREPIKSILSGFLNITLCDPVGYLDMIYLLKHSAAVLTDSGGIQEEAPALGKRVLVARRVTERPEGVTAGVATLVGTDPQQIVASLEREVYGTRNVALHTADTPYGDGKAGTRIADIVLNYLTGSPRETTDWTPEAITALT
jgi:UDP-N-acetylglucosamine 2-epimerase (non-hydrolysing)